MPVRLSGFDNAGPTQAGASELVGTILPSAHAPWMRNGACREQKNPDLFYPATRRKPKQIRTAKQVCDHCPVRERCLLLAVEQEEVHGVWGGYLMEDPRERGTAVREAEDLLGERFPASLEETA